MTLTRASESEVCKSRKTEVQPILTRRCLRRDSNLNRQRPLSSRSKWNCIRTCKGKVDMRHKCNRYIRKDCSDHCSLLILVSCWYNADIGILNGRGLFYFTASAKKECKLEASTHKTKVSNTLWKILLSQNFNDYYQKASHSKAKVKNVAKQWNRFVNPATAKQ